MSQPDELFLAFLKDLKEDIRQLDGKFDSMQDILVKNTAVLEEHERRSTASEKRITTLEDKSSDSQRSADKLKGFFIYSGLVLTIAGTVAAIYHNIISTYFLKK